METSGSDPAMQPAAPSVVPAPGFSTARRGFDQGQVLEYIGHLTARLQIVENLERRLRSEAEQTQQQRDAALRERDAVVQQRDEALQQRDAALAERVSAEAVTYEQVSGRVTELLVALDRDVDKIRADAQAEADRIVADARSEAHRMRLEAEEERSSASHEARRAREDAERSVADLTSQRDEILGELRRTCTDFLDVIGRLAASIGGGEDEARKERTAEGGEVAASTSEDRADRTVVIPDVVPERPA